jgi:cytochrome oxidase assembly protein ShyY1
MSIEVGWSKNPNATTSWSGGLISGMIVPDRKSRIRLVSATPAPGLQATAQPTPAVKVSAARNRGYAITWFGLALAALTIYALAVRKRLLARTIRP